MTFCSGTLAEGNSWWRADLEDAYNITIVKVLMPLDEAEATAMNGAMVMVGNETHPDITKDCDKFRNVRAGEWETIKCGMAGSYVRIENEGGGVSLCGI